MERTVKVVLISVASIKGYPRWVWRTVECRRDQRGYRSERGVKIVYESPYLYRPNACRGKGPECNALAHKYAQEHLQEVLGI